MPKFIDLTGQRFGRLVVVERTVNTAAGKARWKCICDCGNETKVTGSDLRIGAVKSCGCLNSELSSERFKTHGLRKHRLYNIWNHMKRRCYDENNSKYKYYGGRGICICDEWLIDFQTFYDWAKANGYSDELSIDRIEVNGNYEPVNCRWSDKRTQTINQRMKSNNTSGVKGVQYNKRDKVYVAFISIQGKEVRLGAFKTIEEATEVRKAAEEKYYNQ